MRSHLLILIAATLMAKSAARGLVDAKDASHLRFMTYYGMNFSMQKSWLNLARASGNLANQFKSVGIPSLAQMPESGVYVRGKGLEPKWEATLTSFVDSLKPSIANGTTIGVFMGDELCCHNSACWASTIQPLSEKLRQLLGPDQIIYENDCADSFANVSVLSGLSMRQHTFRSFEIFVGILM
eukprot:m.372712 g.372712  ORF g.372712 m.372712 type:complete len:183 (-) comp20876_c0_seq8:4171-4719(-)